MGHTRLKAVFNSLYFSSSFLCRGIAVDSQSRMAAFELTSEATIQFTSDLADFFLVRLPARAPLGTSCKEEKRERYLTCGRVFCPWRLDFSPRWRMWPVCVLK